MATQGVVLWSKTAASNATADPAVNMAEGMAPSAVNDGIRAAMASVARWRDDISGSLTTSGTSTAYTLTTNATFASLAAMNAQLITLIPHTTCGADPTLAVDGLTAKQIRTATGVNVASGALVAGTPYMLIYFSSAAEFILIGPLGSVANFSVGGTLAVTGAATLSSTLHLVGAATFDAAATITGAATLSSTLHLVGAATLDSTLAVTGATTGAAATFSGALSGASVAGAMVATQAEQETGTATDRLVAPGRQKFNPLHPKAWGSFGGNGATVAAGACSASGSGGAYTITLTTAMSSASYCVVASINGAAGMIQASGLGTGGFGITTYNSAGAQTAQGFSVAVFGDQ